MFEIIDLSQEIYTGMPTFPGMPEVRVTAHWSHEQLEGVTDADAVSPAVNLLELASRTTRTCATCTCSSGGGASASSACRSGYAAAPARPCAPSPSSRGEARLDSQPMI